MSEEDFDRKQEDRQTVRILLELAKLVPPLERIAAALEARRARDMESLLRLVALQEELDWLLYCRLWATPRRQAKAARYDSRMSGSGMSRFRG